MTKSVALISDFGLEDIYAGVMKGVINAIDPFIPVIDISHNVLPQNIEQGAYFLYSAYNFFHPGTVFCAVVDPGVGSSRPAIAVKTKNYFFVGPDNGILWPSVKQDGVDFIVALETPEFFLKNVSQTFHGRDIFAPVSSHIARGEDILKMGICRKEMVECDLFYHEESETRFQLKALHVDRFGNIVTSLFWSDITDARWLSICKPQRVTINRYPVAGIFENYVAAPESEPFFIKGSSGFIEVSMKNRSAASYLGIIPGCPLFLEKENHASSR